MATFKNGDLPPRTSRSKIIENYDQLTQAASGLRAVGYRIVVTIGSWDLLHIGHLRYLIKAKECGDILIVGVDTDRGVKLYKGPSRPVVPQVERCEMLTYQAAVDFVTLVDDIDEQGRWQYGLIKAVRPDVFVAVEGSYPPEQIAEIEKYSNHVTVLPRQAEETSTSHFVQVTVKRQLLDKLQVIRKVLEEIERERL